MQDLRSSGDSSSLPISEEILALLDAAPDAMLMIESSGRIIVANTQAEQIFGYPRHELIGQSIEFLVPSRYRGAHPSHRKGFTDDPRVRPMGRGLELFALRKSGEEFPVEISLSPFRTKDQLFVISAIRDVTDRKHADEQIRRLNHELEAKLADLAATNRELEAFSYSVSHDLRAPLRQIDGFSKILMKEAAASLSPESLDYLAQIREGTHQMGKLVDDLLNFSRLGRQQLVLDDNDLDALVASVVTEIRLTGEGKNVTWKLNPLPSIRCDGALVKQVFRNLISNAVKFSSKSSTPTVEIGVKEHTDPPTFFVRDNGVGFDMRYADKLFGVFQRLHLADEFEGTGVGLATVQRIIMKHGGRIWADAEIDKGAAFYFCLQKGTQPL